MRRLLAGLLLALSVAAALALTPGERATLFGRGHLIGNTATRDPTAADDVRRGNVVGRLWLNARTGVIWRNTATTASAAQWVVDNSAATLPCDVVASPVVCYGTRPLTSSWANGNLFDVQRLSDSTTQTIKAIGGATDLATLNSFLSGTAGQVTKWYDQSGNANHAVLGSGTVTITIASPAVITWNNHGLHEGNQVQFSTTGALPTGLSAGVTYWVLSAGLTGNAFEVSTSRGGAAVNTSGTQSGTQTATLTAANAPFVRVVNGQAQLVCDAKEAQLTSPGIVKQLSLPAATWATSVSLFHAAQVLRASAADVIFEAGTTASNGQGLYNNGSNTYGDTSANLTIDVWSGNNAPAVWSLVSTSGAATAGLNESLQTISGGHTAGTPVGGTLCSSRAFGGNYTADAIVYAALGWASQLSSTNQKLVREALYQAFKITPQQQNDNVVLDGASYSGGEGSYYPAIYPALSGQVYGPSVQLRPLLNRPARITNFAVPGQPQSTMTSNYSAHIAPLYDSTAKSNILILDTGGNDYPTATGTVFASIQSYCSAAVTTGWKVYVTTLISAFPNPAYRTWENALNASIRGGTSGCTGYIDIGADPNLGNDSNITGTLPNTWFNNDASPHPTAFGYGVWDGWLAPQIDQALGP